jgi:hypothetical protein
MWTEPLLADLGDQDGLQRPDAPYARGLLPAAGGLGECLFASNSLTGPVFQRLRRLIVFISF